MILVDANLLIYAVNPGVDAHVRARAWWERTLSGTEAVGIPWIVALAFMRLTTRQGIFERPLSVERAIAYVGGWLAQPYVTLLVPGPDHWPVFATFCERHGASGNLTSDAHIAALAIEHGATVFSADHDFRRFAGVRHVDPLETPPPGPS